MKILITGAGGFLGSRILKLLREEGHLCQFAARGDYPNIRALGAQQIRGDLAEFSVAEDAVGDCDAVFHVAAKAGVWGDLETYRRANVRATENIVKAAENANVKYLIHTSTPSVTFNGNDVKNGPQSLPYPEHFLTAYAQTKAEAERIALNFKTGKAIALRPHLIYGPGDPHLLPRLIEKHKKGQVKQVGDGKNIVDITYIDNAAIAHLQALHAFVDGNYKAHGKAYFISDDAPVNLWEFLNRSLEALGYTRISSSISHEKARFAGAALEKFHRLFRPQIEPRMTRFVADNLATSHWYDMTPAKMDFGYQPSVEPEIGFERMIENLRKRGYANSKVSSS